MTKKKRGRPPAAGTKGFQEAHRANVWAKARAAKAKLDQIVTGGVMTRETVAEVMALAMAEDREIVSRWGAGALRVALPGPAGSGPASVRLTDAVDELFTALRGDDEPRPPVVPAVRPPKPADNSTWSYETSLREAGAVRLGALAELSDLKAGLESGELVTREAFEERYMEKATDLRQRAVTVPGRFAMQLGTIPDDDLAREIVAELLEVVT